MRYITISLSKFEEKKKCNAINNYCRNTGITENDIQKMKKLNICFNILIMSDFSFSKYFLIEINNG